MVLIYAANAAIMPTSPPTKAMPKRKTSLRPEKQSPADIGATWKLGRKSAAEKAKDEEARRLEKAEEMKKLAQDAKVKAQAERHAKLLAEREAQKTA